MEKGLVKNAELAGELADFLEGRFALGDRWVVFDTDQPISGSWDLSCFADVFQAEELAREYQQIFSWHEAMAIGDLVYRLREIEYSFNYKNMNRNSLENFLEEAKALKVPQGMIEAAEKQMALNVPKFEIHGQIPGDKGSKLDLTIHLKQSGKSDFYYFNKYELAVNKGKPLAEGHQYMVVNPDGGQDGKPLKRGFDSVVKAMDYFKSQQGNSELSRGKFTAKDFDLREVLSTMKDGKIDYVKKEFKSVFYSPVIKNAHYVNRGKGFSIEQAANMLQGRSVFREDMVSRAGLGYKAWNIYLFDRPKDKYGNYEIKQFSEGYGFDLKTELAKYDIKELGQQQSAEKLMAALQNGNRVAVTATDLEGPRLVFLDAAPRYNNVNFSLDKGESPHREQFYTPAYQKIAEQEAKSKHKAQGKAAGAEISM